MSILFNLIKYKGVIPFESGLDAFLYFFIQIFSIIMFLFFLNQTIYLIVGTFYNKKLNKQEYEKHKIGIVISARNESRVI